MTRRAIGILSLLVLVFLGGGATVVS